MTKLERINSLGWNIPESTETWEENGHLFYREGAVDDITGYVVEIDPETGASRHIGNGEGCFWTEWEGGDPAAKTIHFKVFEDNGGGLSLFVLDTDGTPVWGHSGYEYAPENLLEDIKNLRELESLEELSSWDGNGTYYGAGDFQPWDETPAGDVTAAYAELAESEWTDLVADENGTYPEKMGNVAREAFNLEE